MIETVSLDTRCDVGQRIIRLLNSSIRLDISYKGKPLLTKIFRKKQALTLKYPGCSLKVSSPHLTLLPVNATFASVKSTISFSSQNWEL